MGNFLKIATLAVSAIMASTAAFAEEGFKNGVTPYGDSCNAPYGICKKQMQVYEAVDAMKVYFEEKGMHIEIIEHKGRFIKVNIFRGHDRVDCILFDRKTGRMRSIY